MLRPGSRMPSRSSTGTPPVGPGPQPGGSAAAVALHRDDVERAPEVTAAVAARLGCSA